MPYYTNLLDMGAPVRNDYSPFRIGASQPSGLFGPVGAGPPIRRATLPGPWTPPPFDSPTVDPPIEPETPDEPYDDDSDPDDNAPSGSSDGTSDTTGFSSTDAGSYDGGYGGGYGGTYGGGTDYSFSDFQSDRDASFGSYDIDEIDASSSTDQIASGYADAVDAKNKANQKSREATWGGLLSDPLEALSKWGADPVNIPGLMMSMAGLPFGSTMLNAIGNYNLKTQAYDRAHTAMGTPGYSHGTIDGEPYSIGVNAAGMRAMTGVTPDWFTVDMADNMSTVSQGYDPNTGDSLTGFGKGRGGYNSRGDFVDQYGNVSHFGDWSDLEALADERGLTTSQVEQAIDTTRNTDLDLETALDIVSDRDQYGRDDVDHRGLGDDYGTATNPDVATVEGVAGVTMDSDEFKHDPIGDDMSAASKGANAAAAATAAAATEMGWNDYGYDDMEDDRTDEEIDDDMGFGDDSEW